MAVARISSAESVRTATTDPWTFTYDPGATVRGVVLAVVHGVSGTALAVSATYGGVAMSLTVEATDTATEPGNAQLWFLGANVPTGSQTVSVDLTSASTTDIHFVIWGLSGDANLVVVDSDEINGNAANPTVTLAKGGRTAICIAAMYGGGSAPGGTLATGNTLDHTHDLGAFYSQSCYETTVDAADHTIGWSTLGTDDLAFVAIAVSEVTTGTGASTLAGATSAGAGTIINPVTGTGSATLTGATSAGVGVETATGTGTTTLAGATSAGTGVETLTATGSSTLAGATSVGVGTETFTSSGASTLEGPVSVGTGTVVNPVTGTGASTLDGATSAGVGVESFIGAGTSTVDGVTAAGVGVETFTGTGSLILEGATSAGVGVETVTGTGASTLAGVTSAGSGVEGFTGSGTTPLTGATSAGSGTESYIGTGTPSLDGVASAGAGTVLTAIIGSGSPTLAGIACTGVGAVTIPPVVTLVADATVTSQSRATVVSRHRVEHGPAGRTAPGTGRRATVRDKVRG